MGCVKGVEPSVSALRNEGIDVTPPVCQLSLPHLVTRVPYSALRPYFYCMSSHAFVIGKRAVTVGALYESRDVRVSLWARLFSKSNT